MVDSLKEKNCSSIFNTSEALQGFPKLFGLNLYALSGLSTCRQSQLMNRQLSMFYK